MVNRNDALLERVADREERLDAAWIACIVYLAGYAGYCFEEPISSLRYLTYATPLILLSAMALRRESVANLATLAFLFAYLVMSIFRLLADANGDNLFLANTLIIALSILTYASAGNVSISHIRAIFLCSLAYFIVAYWLAAPGEIRLYQIFQNKTGSGLENGFDNNQGGLLGPIYAVFFYSIGERLQLGLALGESVLGGKRIGIVAVVAGLISFHFIRSMRSPREWRNRFIVLLGTLTIINIVGCNLPVLSESFHGEAADISIEEVMLGRHAIGVELTRSIAARSVTQSLFGTGAGSADALAVLASDGTLSEPHNDWLKILFDYGLIGSAVMTMFFAAIFSASAVGATLAIANAVIMTTDNVLIYLYYQVPIALMAAYSASRERQKVANAGHS